ncbi:MAG TPA: substrate-binding domain-containing protein [Candidatus Dormibacteraeota bacterium]|jgi:iron(III) transport system substrate-binding protein|nr:substrate-binding domain-containing protein [Candidatus Dormibacteraeota bacterium]
MPAYCAGTDQGQVVLYSARGLDYWYSEVLSNFELDCKVRIFFADAASDQLLARLRTEAGRPYADVVIAEPPFISTAAAENLLGTGGLPEAVGVAGDRCDRLRRWCTLVENYASWTYDPALDQPPPRTWDDLLAAPYHQQVLTSRPDRGLDGFAALELLTHTLGEDAAFAYLRQLEGSVSAHYQTTDVMSRVESLGGARAANGDLQENLNDIDQFVNLGIWFPTSAGSAPATLALPFGAATVRGGHNPKNAHALLAYLWSADAQRLVGRSYVAPSRSGVVPTDDRSLRLRALLAGVTVMRLDWEAEAAAQQRLTDRWLAFRAAPDATIPALPSPSPLFPGVPPPSPRPSP